MNHGDLKNLILGTIENWIAGRHTERHAVVTSYDPKKYLAKVAIMPEGQITGWLPIETGHIGQGYGITVGLQPGQGPQQTAQGAPDDNSSNNQQQQGDQVIIRLQEGDIESAKIVQRVHSSKDKPPETQSGEMIFWTKFKNNQQSSGGSGGGSGTPAAQGQGEGKGPMIFFKNDGSLTITDGNGASLNFDGNGNISINCKNHQISASDSIVHGAQNNFGINAKGIMSVLGGSFLGLDAAKGPTVYGGGSSSSLAGFAQAANPTTGLSMSGSASGSFGLSSFAADFSGFANLIKPPVPQPIVKPFMVPK